ncbi:SPOC domain-like protein [Coprinopsis marcescibilis]|uniref:ATP-dependent DNA helicase II subunit 2 n=1 Tax=Coprinopsis marcescibilis TaxID=230819 RepID=A0A5C3KJ32_COPMA|nr:SPOC domain-like protein [Coprinopsis marcescibilis]
MPAERAGYTVSMFVIDASPTMGNVRHVELPPGPNGEVMTTEMTNLEWCLRYVKLKIQEMIFNGRKTDQCGVIVFGSDITDNIVNKESGGEGYANVQEYISIGQPNVGTIAKLDALRPSESSTGDPLDALIVALETQGRYLASKKSWTRKVFLVTDGEGPVEAEDWQDIVKKMQQHDVFLTIVGVDFDDPELGYEYPDKSRHKKVNEAFYKDFVHDIGEKGIVGTMDYALQEVVRPEPKQTRSTLMGTVLRIGNADFNADEAIQINVKASKCTALARPATLKKYAMRQEADDMDVDGEGERKAVYAQLKMRTEYYVESKEGAEDDEDEDGANIKKEDESAEGTDDTQKPNGARVEKEDLVRGFKYGTTYAPCPDGQFPKLSTVKGIDILGFFPKKNLRREYLMGEIQYIWADEKSPHQQVALSSVVQALDSLGRVAIARWVNKDGADIKMGVLVPCVFEKADCFLWARLPFADDVRKYTFASLERLVSKKGEEVKEHPYLPTQEQLNAMDAFVDAMDLGDVGEPDEEGVRGPWFDTRNSYNPAIHRVKQAIFHSAVVSDIPSNPLPPPHPDLVQFFEPPKRALKRARKPLERCKEVFNVKEVTKRVAKAKKEGHDHINDEDEMLLLDRKPTRTQSSFFGSGSQSQVGASASFADKKPADDGSDTEDDNEELLLNAKPPATPAPSGSRGPLPTPARSVSPRGLDPGRAPGKIIGNTDPLRDFKKNLAGGDLVTKAVEDMAVVITEIVLKPFAKRRAEELIECMKAMRKTCLEEDEVDAWNAFIVNLKSKCNAKPGNPAFWNKVKEVGRDLSYISDKEAERFGGSAQYTEKQAKELVES